MHVEDLKTMAEVARDMGLSEGRISQLCNEHDIVGRRIGAARLLSPRQVKKLKSVKRRSYTKPAQS